MLLEDAPNAAAALRAALEGLPARERDGFVDRVLAVDSADADGQELPRGCVPYMPCRVDLLVQLVDWAEVRPDDVFVDVGSGVGRATALVHCLTRARTIGIEIQSHLVESARNVSSAFDETRISTLHGDASQLVRTVGFGTVFFFYCPFSGERFERIVDVLGEIAARHPIRIGCVDLPPLARPWLEPISRPSGELVVYRSVGRGTAD
jgi:hypothetical protein